MAPKATNEVNEQGSMGALAHRRPLRIEGRAQRAGGRGRGALFAALMLDVCSDSKPAAPASAAADSCRGSGGAAPALNPPPSPRQRGRGQGERVRCLLL